MRERARARPHPQLVACAPRVCEPQHHAARLGARLLHAPPHVQILLLKQHLGRSGAG